MRPSYKTGANFWIHFYQENYGYWVWQMRIGSFGHNDYAKGYAAYRESI